MYYRLIGWAGIIAMAYVPYFECDTFFQLSDRGTRLNNGIRDRPQARDVTGCGEKLDGLVRAVDPAVGSIGDNYARYHGVAQGIHFAEYRENLSGVVQ